MQFFDRRVKEMPQNTLEQTGVIYFLCEKFHSFDVELLFEVL